MHAHLKIYYLQPKFRHVIKKFWCAWVFNSNHCFMQYLSKESLGWFIVASTPTWYLSNRHYVNRKLRLPWALLYYQVKCCAFNKLIWLPSVPCKLDFLSFLHMLVLFFKKEVVMAQIQAMYASSELYRSVKMTVFRPNL